MKELELKNIKYACQQRIPIYYKGHLLEKHLVLDLLVEDKIILELKAVSELLPVHQAQLLTYLKLTGKKIGYLVNFDVALLKHGIKRIRNGY